MTFCNADQETRQRPVELSQYLFVNFPRLRQKTLAYEAFPCSRVGYLLVLDTPTVAPFSAKMRKTPYEKFVRYCSNPDSSNPTKEGAVA